MPVTSNPLQEDIKICLSLDGKSQGISIRGEKSVFCSGQKMAVLLCSLFSSLGSVFFFNAKNRFSDLINSDPSSRMPHF